MASSETVVEYVRFRGSHADNLRIPVYAGDDGSVVVFNVPKERWEQLNQSHDKTNGYWVVSVPKKNPLPGDKPRSEIDVHWLICRCWKGDPPPGSSRVDHLNGDPDDNRACNLDWIAAYGNATKAKKHEKQFPADYASVIVNCAQLNQGFSILDSVSIEKNDGTSITARVLVGHGKGRPPTRLSSLLETLFRESLDLANGKSSEKAGREIQNEDIVWRDLVEAFPNRMKIIKRAC